MALPMNPPIGLFSGHKLVKDDACDSGVGLNDEDLPREVVMPWLRPWYHVVRVGGQSEGVADPKPTECVDVAGGRWQLALEDLGGGPAEETEI